MATKTKSAANETQAFPFGDVQDTGRDTALLPEGRDVPVTQFIVTFLERQDRNSPRGEQRRQLFMIRDDEVPRGSSPLIEANKVVAAMQAASAPGVALSLATGKRMMRRVTDEAPGFGDA